MSNNQDEAKMVISIFSAELKAQTLFVAYSAEELYQILLGNSNTLEINGKQFMKIETCYHREVNPENHRQIAETLPETIYIERSKISAFVTRDLSFKVPRPSDLIIAKAQLPKDLT